MEHDPTPPCGAQLTVTLRDATDAPVSGAQIQVRDLEGVATIGQTDTTGTVQLCGAVGSTVRVRVTGTLLDHTALYQPGEDADGIRLVLDGPQVPLNLRIEPDGLIRPDPVTMIAPDRGAAAWTRPTDAALLMVAPTPVSRTMIATATSVAAPAYPPAVAESSSPATLVFSVLLILLTAVMLWRSRDIWGLT